MSRMNQPRIPGRVNISSLKLLVARLPVEDALRLVVLTDRDELEPAEFLAKLDVWLRLLNQVSG